MSECFDAVVDGRVWAHTRDDAYGGDSVPESWGGGEEAVDVVTTWLTRHRQIQPGPVSLR